MVMEKVQLTEEQWRERLTPEQYQVLRKAGTEPPFTGEMLSVKDDGTFTCAACGLELFDSSTKYESGSGWPSFWASLGSDRVALHEDALTSWCVRRCAAPAATRTWGTCSTTAPTPPGSASA